MTRLPFILGNWKMNRIPSESQGYASKLRIALESHREALGTRIEVGIAPPYPVLDALGRALDGSGIALAAQNVHAAPEGAFTGEVSTSMLEDLGCRYALIGHSERRQLFGETSAVVAAKALQLLDSKLDPILCVGETLDEHERGAALSVVDAQLAAILDLDGPERGDGLRRRLVVAYEPIWAIGTGRTATPELAQQVHASIREHLIRRLGESGRQIRILYGGSVKPSNARALLAQPDIDGALVGGASLEPETFAEIALSALPSARTTDPSE